LEQRLEIVDCGVEKFFLSKGEIATGFCGEHFQGVDHGFCGAQVDLFFPRVRIGDLAEKEASILGLENDKVIEAGIGFWRCGHAEGFIVGDEDSSWKKGSGRIGGQAGEVSFKMDAKKTPDSHWGIRRF
jgi:hypothetical protein